jgi:hypothetical protein
MSRRVIGLALVMLSFPVAGAGQEKAEEPAVPMLTLRVKREFPVRGLTGAPMWLPVRCDLDGNLYAKLDPTLAGDPWGPVTKITKDGQPAATFSVEAVPGFQKQHVGGWTVGLRGEVYFIVGRDVGDEHRLFILEFRPDGSHAATIELDQLFMPLLLVALPDGSFLATGMTVKLNRTPADPPPEPFTALVERSGRVRPLHLLDDVQRPASGNAEEGKPLGPDPVMAAVTGGEAIVSEEGFIYLFRRGEEPFAFVLDYSGHIERRLRLKPPRSGYRLITTKVAGGRVAALFEIEKKAESRNDSPRRILSLYDAQTGERIADYLVPRELSGAFACYTPEAFLFLGPKEQERLMLQVAGP